LDKTNDGLDLLVNNAAVLGMVLQILYYGLLLALELLFEPRMKTKII
jgi:hypothetical protein